MSLGDGDNRPTKGEETLPADPQAERKTPLGASRWASRLGGLGGPSSLGFRVWLPVSVPMRHCCAAVGSVPAKQRWQGRCEPAVRPHTAKCTQSGESWGLGAREGIHLRVQSVSRVSRNVISVC